MDKKLQTTWKERICYGIGDVGVNLVWLAFQFSYALLYGCCCDECWLYRHYDVNMSLI